MKLFRLQYSEFAGLLNHLVMTGHEKISTRLSCINQPFIFTLKLVIVMIVDLEIAHRYSLIVQSLIINDCFIREYRSMFIISISNTH